MGVFRNVSTVFYAAVFLQETTPRIIHDEEPEEDLYHDDGGFDFPWHRYVIFVICCFGTAGNLLNIAVLTQHRVRRSVESQEAVVYFGLVSLAVTDLLFCVSMLPKAFVPERILFQSRGFCFFYQLYSQGLITTFSLLSTWFIVMTAGVRYIGICHPLKARYLVSRHGTVTVLAVVALIGCLVNLPSFWTFKVNDLSTPFRSEYLFDLGPFSHTTPIGFLFLWFRTIVGVFVPLLLLLFFNSRLIVALRRSDRFRRHSELSFDRNREQLDATGSGTRILRTLSPKNSGEGYRRPQSVRNRLTTLLVVIVVCFFVLVCPSEIMDFLSHLTGLVDPDPETFMTGRLLMDTLQVSNFSLNFLLYCVMSARFRKTLAAMLCRCCGRRCAGGHLRNMAGTTALTKRLNAETSDPSVNLSKTMRFAS